MSNVADALPASEIYYDTRGKQYYILNNRDRWIPISESSARRHLKDQGYLSSLEPGQVLSPIDRALNVAQTEHDVEYANPLAGHNAGVYQMNGSRILVTNSPNIIQPKEGEFPLLDGILEGMFNNEVCDQRSYVNSWLKIGYASFRDRQWQPGQVLALAGPVRSAKSLFQWLVTLICGGRSAQPYQYMTGGTTFNADLFAAEHLMIEDVAESTDIRKRRAFAAAIKGFAVNREHRCHGKGLNALVLNPHWRVTVSLNDEPERLMVLPPINDDIADKIMLLKVRRREMPMPTRSAAEVDAFAQALKAELPAFLHFLTHWNIPENLRSPRFGVIHYHHPDILEGLQVFSPEQQLLEMIDAEVFRRGLPHPREWVGTAARLQNKLCDNDCSWRQQALALLHSPVACGTYLSRLTNDFPERFTSRIINGTREYTIQPPEAQDQQC